MEKIEGSFKAKLLAFDFGEASTGTQQIGCLFEFTDEPLKGQQIMWYGFFTPEAFPVTVRALKELGWSAASLDTIRKEVKLGSVVMLVCESERYNGRDRNRVKFINRQGLVRMDNTLTGEQRRGLAASVADMLAAGLHNKKAAVAESGAPAVPSDDDDIPF